jgi:16S rRNA (adenine1518-N6/adenine1519-N6)-dimethyltransferase
MKPVKAKKHLGQHFLNDTDIADRIVQTLLHETERNIIEVGPGMGVLTDKLIEKENFFAVDVDEESALYLRKKYPLHEQKIIQGDFLQMDLDKLFHDKFSVIGNFPYNISSQIMFKVLDHKDRIDQVVGMFQKEVAERIAVKPGTKTYGILSVLLQAYYDIEYLFTVHENSFNPPPKVKSAVIKAKRNAVKKLDCDERLFKAIVKAAFNQRRKMLRNSVKSFVKDNSIFSHPYFTNRPERLSVHDFVELTKMIEKQQG